MSEDDYSYEVPVISDDNIITFSTTLNMLSRKLKERGVNEDELLLNDRMR